MSPTGLAELTDWQPGGSESSKLFSLRAQLATGSCCHRVAVPYQQYVIAMTMASSFYFLRRAVSAGNPDSGGSVLPGGPGPLTGYF